MRFLRVPEVKNVFGWGSDSTMYEMLKNGTLTKGVLIGLRSRGWPDHECQAIARARCAGYNDDQLRQLVDRLHAERAQMAASL